MPRIYRLLCMAIVLATMTGAIGLLPPRSAAGDEIQQEEPFESLYLEAVALFNERRYSEAVRRLEEINLAGIEDGPLKAKVDRHLGEALYRLGRDRGNDYLLRAVAQLKHILKMHRDTPEQNIPVKLMLARTYEALDFRHEALSFYQQAEKVNRDAKLEQEIGFKIIRLLNQLRRHRQAIERLRDYLKKFPQGPYTSPSLFILADSYEQLNLRAQASLWYGEAKKLTPDLTVVPVAILLRYGQHLTELKAHREAIEVLSLVVNVFSPHELTSGALKLLARNHAALQGRTLALKYLSLAFSEAKTPEASFHAALRIVEMGISTPGLRIPSFFPGMDKYTDPLAALELLDSLATRVDVRRELRIKKAALLMQMGNLRESLDIHLEILRQRPPKDRHAHLLTMARQNAATLLKIHLDKDEHLEAVALYSELNSHGLDLRDHGAQLLGLGSSFLALGLYDQARLLYGTYLSKIADRRLRTEFQLALAETELRAGRYEQVETVVRAIGKEGKIAEKTLEGRAWQLLAESQWRRGMSAMAVETYRRATLTGVALPAPQLLHQGDALRKSGMLKAAIGSYQTALKMLGTSKNSGDLRRQIQMRLADSFFASRDYRAAIDAYAKIQTENAPPGENHWVTYRIGMAFMALGEYRQAEKFLAALQEQAAQDAYWTGLAETSLMAVRRRIALR